MTQQPPLSVLGGRIVGRAMAGDLARRGAEAALCNQTPDHITEIAAVGGVDVEGHVGTNDQVDKAEVLAHTIRNGWSAA